VKRPDRLGDIAHNLAVQFLNWPRYFLHPPRGAKKTGSSQNGAKKLLDSNPAPMQPRAVEAPASRSWI
jgi:hypothetical protein